jgi:hypothetical protein
MPVPQKETLANMFETDYSAVSDEESERKLSVLSTIFNLACVQPQDYLSLRIGREKLVRSRGFPPKTGERL